MNTPLNSQISSKERLLLAGTFILFAIIYCLISVVDHYQFKTAALDLGLYNNALYSFSHFKSNYFTLDLKASGVNFFGDHFSPITYLYVPFYYIFGSYTRIIIQIASILWGGYGVYKCCKRKFPTGYIPLIITFQFFGIWGIYGALSFDFHHNVVGAMVVPWLIYFYETQRKKNFLLCFILVLTSKENMALWLGFIMLGLMLKNGLRNYKNYLRFEIPLAAFALIYFFVTITYVMPWLQSQNTNYQFNHYGSLGNSMPQVMANMFKHPLEVIRLLFENPTLSASEVNTKLELHLAVLLSGGLALLYRPYYLVMLLPVYFQKLMTNDPSLSGVDAQYSIEFAPILSLALADSISALSSQKMKMYFSSFYLITTFIATFYLLDHMEISTNARFYKASHYDSDLNTSEIYDALKLIPQDVPVSASSALTPHLANREKIYAFPNIVDAQYILLLDAKVRSTYPLSIADYITRMDSLKNCGSFVTLYDKNQLLILKKK